MRRYKVNEVLKMLEADGLVSCKAERQSQAIQASDKER